ncbi:MAG: hypothetical protein OEZ22_12675 [Spirochaetia bacterium]|nr:hypothetical protein [Spirochaetia bacterium]
MKRKILYHKFLIFLMLTIFSVQNCKDEPEEDIEEFITYEKEGSSAEPVILNYNIDLPYEGQVAAGKGSYYQINGLTAGTFYKISLTNLTDDLGITIYEGQSFSSRDMLEYTNEKDIQDEITIINPMGTVISIEVGGFLADRGSAFILSIEPYEIQSVTAGDLPYSGTVEAPFSIIEVNGLDSSKAYTVSLTGLTADVNMVVLETTNLNLIESLLCLSINFGMEDEICTAKPADGTIYIQILAEGNSTETSFTLNIQPVTFTQLVYNTDLPFSDTAEKNFKYYELSGLTAGLEYKINLYGVTDDTALAIYNDVGLKNMVCGLTAKIDGISCVVKPAGASVYIAVATEFTMPFTLDAAEITTVQLPYSEGFSYADFVDTTVNNYEITGLVDGNIYKISITGMTDNVDLIVYTTAGTIVSTLTGINTIVCVSTAGGVYDEECDIQAQGTGLFFMIGGWHTSAGADYTINLSTF